MSTGDRDDGPAPSPTRPDETPPRGSATVEIPRQTDARAARRRRRRDTMRGLPALRGKVRKMVRDAEERADRTDKRYVQWPLQAIRVVAQVVRQWARDRCPQQAASLAFQTVLSVVPLVAVCLAVLRATGSLSEQSALVEFIARDFIPISEQEISEKLIALSENVSFESLGTVGLVTTVVLAFVMINSLEKIANYIWRSERKRSMTQKFVVFYATATVGPVLLATGLYQAAQVGLTEGFSGFLISLLTTFSAMLLANLFLPACPVRIKPALWGAVVATLLFEISKYAFNAYVTEFALERYEGVYGAVAVLPLWLLWIYYTWLTLLFGFEVAHAVQNLHLLERVDRRGPMSLERELLQRVNGITGARIMVTIARAYARGDKAVSRRQLEHQFDLSDEVLTRITSRLKEHDLIIEVEGDVVGFLPARPPTEISLARVLRAFRGDDFAPTAAGAESSTKLEKVLTDIEADTLQRTGHLYLDELI